MCLPVLQKHLLSRHFPLPEQSLGQLPPGRPGSVELPLLLLPPSLLLQLLAFALAAM
jgi:hypothetical protein